jgi:hypothetical protein
VAGPANPSWDLAFCAWSWVPLHHPELTRALGGPDESTQTVRLRLLCDSYGESNAAGLLSLVEARVLASREGIRAGAEAGDPVMRRLVAEGHATDMDRTLDYLHRRGTALRQLLAEQEH